MIYSDILKEYFPDIVTNSFINNEIINVVGTEFDTLCSKKADLALQFNVDTATWGLDYYEKDLGIKTDYTKSYDDRRSVIKSRWRGTGGKFTSILIKIVCDSFTNGATEVTYDGIIHVRFTSIIGIPSNINDLKEVVEQIKPAYKLLEYIYYNTHKLLSAFAHEELAQYTHEQLREIQLAHLYVNKYIMLAQYTHDQLKKYTHQELRKSQLN